ncbi:hypothetical protein RB653_009589 [Dictyostelium firmibasis]|uniref:Uncharacterized protein n=1 Tax=Dictyostelium firmibasis TaxID=79012 RepID=A0AAN7YTX8_9MYCE
MLLPSLYYLDRVDDTIYLFDTVPHILLNPDTFQIFTTGKYLYKVSSSYYLNLFINYKYFLNN